VLNGLTVVVDGAEGVVGPGVGDGRFVMRGTPGRGTENDNVVVCKGIGTIASCNHCIIEY